MAAFTDNQGVTRHAMSREQLEALYKQLENFIADSTFEEVSINNASLNNVKTMIAGRIREIRNDSTDKLYKELKEKHPKAIILFRDGKVYFSLNDDAVKVADACGLPLVSENGRKKALFVSWELDNILPRLVRHGYKVAICDNIK